MMSSLGLIRTAQKDASYHSASCVCDWCLGMDWLICRVATSPDLEDRYQFTLNADDPPSHGWVPSLFL